MSKEGNIEEGIRANPKADSSQKKKPLAKGAERSSLENAWTLYLACK